VPGRFILAARLRRGGHAWWPSWIAWREARGARSNRVAPNAWCGVRAVRARAALYVHCQDHLY